MGQVRLLEVCRIIQRQGQVRIASWRRWTLEEVVCNQISPVSGSACLTDLSATKAVRTGLRRLNWFGRTQRGTNSADQTADDGLSGRGHPTRRTQTGCMDSPDRNLGTVNSQVVGSNPTPEPHRSRWISCCPALFRKSAHGRVAQRLDHGDQPDLAERDVLTGELVLAVVLQALSVEKRQVGVALPCHDPAADL